MAPPTSKDEFSVNTQFVTAGDESPQLNIAAPPHRAELDVNVQFVTVGDESPPLHIAPPLR